MIFLRYDIFFLKKLSRWWIMLLSISILILFIYVIGPIGLQLPLIKPVADFVEEYGINANGYYYTDVEEFIDAEMYLKNSMRFAPDRSKNSN